MLLADGDNSTEGVTQADAIRELVESDVALYAIAVRSAESNGDQLREVAEEVGGIFTTAETTEELESLYENIAARLASRYQLTFQSDNAAGGNLVVSVAQGTAVATTRTTLQGFGTPAASEEPDGPARVLNVPEEATLGAVSAPNPGLLGQPLMLPIGAAAVFLSLLFLGLLVANPAIDVRLDTASGAGRIAPGDPPAIVDRRQVRRSPRSGRRVDKALDAAGLHFRPGEFVLISIVVVVLLSAAGSLLGGALLGVLLGGLGAVGVLVYLNRRAQKQRNRFADQLTDTLSILIGSLRAGRGLPQAIELVAAESPSPTAEQFRRVVFETQVGRDMTESMMGVAHRMKSQDFEWVARAIAINRELGGDLTEVLRNVGNTIRGAANERMVQALSAEGRASGWVLLALPVVNVLFLWWRDAGEYRLARRHGPRPYHARRCCVRNGCRVPLDPETRRSQVLGFEGTRERFEAMPLIVWLGAVMLSASLPIAWWALSSDRQLSQRVSENLADLSADHAAGCPRVLSHRTLPPTAHAQRRFPADAFHPYRMDRFQGEFTGPSRMDRADHSGSRCWGPS